jgi:trehalose synthase-fused probable maltokinase
MVQQQVPSRGTEWQRALDEVRAYCQSAVLVARTRAERSERMLPSVTEIEDAMGAYRVTIDMLGRRTADLHRTMAGIERDGFGVHTYGRDDLDRLVRDVKAHAVRALDIARVRRDTLQPESVERLDRLLAMAPAIDATIEAVLSIEEAGKRIRTHSDFHLGQVLEVDQDVFFIDFEGEPARPIAERRVPQSPLRDVAGMLRSFGYAARAGWRMFVETNPDQAALLEPWIAGWERHASALYLAGYLKTIGELGLLPEPRGRELLLRVLLLDKAFYELAYELNNRPDWVDIPLAGLLALLERPGVS